MIGDSTEPDRRQDFVTAGHGDSGGIVPVPFSLPAYQYQAWWADEREPKTHVQKRSIHEAGYRVGRYDLAARTVTFVRAR